MDRAEFERRERAKCREKVPWTTERLASNAVLLWALAGYLVTYYPCPWCPCWHLTSHGRDPMPADALDRVAAALG